MVGGNVVVAADVADVAGDMDVVVAVAHSGGMAASVHWAGGNLEEAVEEVHAVYSLAAYSVGAVVADVAAAQAVPQIQTDDVYKEALHWHLADATVEEVEYSSVFRSATDKNALDFAVAVGIDMEHHLVPWLGVSHADCVSYRDAGESDFEEGCSANEILDALDQREDGPAATEEEAAAGSADPPTTKVETVEAVEVEDEQMAVVEALLMMEQVVKVPCTCFESELELVVAYTLAVPEKLPYTHFAHARDSEKVASFLDLEKAGASLDRDESDAFWGPASDALLGPVRAASISDLEKAVASLGRQRSFLGLEKVASTSVREMAVTSSDPKATARILDPGMAGGFASRRVGLGKPVMVLPGHEPELYCFGNETASA